MTRPSVVRAWRERKQAIAGYGHPLHKRRDPRVDALFAVAREQGADLRYLAIAEAVERAIPQVLGRELKLNVSAPFRRCSSASASRRRRCAVCRFSPAPLR